MEEYQQGKRQLRPDYDSNCRTTLMRQKKKSKTDQWELTQCSQQKEENQMRTLTKKGDQ